MLRSLSRAGLSRPSWDARSEQPAKGIVAVGQSVGQAEVHPQHGTGPRRSSSTPVKRVGCSFIGWWDQFEEQNVPGGIASEDCVSLVGSATDAECIDGVIVSEDLPDTCRCGCSTRGRSGPPTR